MHSERNRTEEHMTGLEGGTSYYGEKIRITSVLTGTTQLMIFEDVWPTEAQICG